MAVVQVLITTHELQMLNHSGVYAMLCSCGWEGGSEDRETVRTMGRMHLRDVLDTSFHGVWLSYTSSTDDRPVRLLRRNGLGTWFRRPDGPA